MGSDPQLFIACPFFTKNGDNLQIRVKKTMEGNLSEVLSCNQEERI